MGDTKYVYECVCGQLTAVNPANERPRCSRCREQTFTYILRYDSVDSRAGSNWFKSRLQTPDDNGYFDPKLELNPMPIDDLIDGKSQLRLTRARAMLDHLDMLRQSKAIDDDLFEKETQQVLQRVVRMLRSGTPETKA